MNIFGSGEASLLLSVLFSILLPLILGLIPATIADGKGRNFLSWWIFGALLFPVALLAAILINPTPEVLEKRKINAGNMIKCPFCAEIIKREARVCRYCGREMPWVQPMQTQADSSSVFCPNCHAAIDISGLHDGVYDCPNCHQKIELE